MDRSILLPTPRIYRVRAARLLRVVFFFFSFFLSTRFISKYRVGREKASNRNSAIERDFRCCSTTHVRVLREFPRCRKVFVALLFRVRQNPQFYSHGPPKKTLFCNRKRDTKQRLEFIENIFQSVFMRYILVALLRNANVFSKPKFSIAAHIYFSSISRT